MSEAKQNITCPLGSECDVHKLNKVSGEIERYTCRWWIKRDSQHPETKEITTIKDCAMSWLPLMLHENAKQQVNTTAAVDDLKNVMNTTGEAMTNQMIVANQINSQNLLQKY